MCMLMLDALVVVNIVGVSRNNNQMIINCSRVFFMGHCSLHAIVQYMLLFTCMHVTIQEYKDQMAINACSGNKIDEQIQAYSS
jgi:hypothetical protein